MGAAAIVCDGIKCTIDIITTAKYIRLVQRFRYKGTAASVSSPLGRKNTTSTVVRSAVLSPIVSLQCDHAAVRAISCCARVHFFSWVAARREIDRSLTQHPVLLRAVNAAIVDLFVIFSFRITKEATLFRASAPPL